MGPCCGGRRPKGLHYVAAVERAVDKKAGIDGTDAGAGDGQQV